MEINNIDVILDGYPPGDYMLIRDELLPRIAERICCLYGLPNISIMVSNTVKTVCSLTRNGVVIRINQDSAVAMSKNSGLGVRGELPLEIADLITITHQVFRARDYLDPTFTIETVTEKKPKGDHRFFYDKKQEDQLLKYFNSCIDDTAIDMQLRDIGLFTGYFNQYASRLRSHVLAGYPLHMQFMEAIRLICIESNPFFVVEPIIDTELSSLGISRRDPGTIILSIMERGLPFSDRRELSYEYLRPIYETLFKEDLRRSKTNDFIHLYEKDNPYGDFEHSALSEFSDRENDLSADDFLYQVTNDHLEEMHQSSSEENKENSNDGDKNDAKGLMLPRKGESSDDLELIKDTTKGYAAAAARWLIVIQRVADILLRLASPKESISVPRWRHIATSEGRRLNPNTITSATIQLQSDIPQAIWQPIKTVTRHQEMQFTGLDIYLLLDVSGSMGGSNAEYATATAICLIEGLRHAQMISQRDQRGDIVDVRIQLVAFGAGWDELTPLGVDLSLQQKEIVYDNLMNPTSNFTMINGALKHVSSQAHAHPDRNILCLIISDGLFSDNLAAFSTVQSMPSRVYVGHIYIRESGGIPITMHREVISDPRVLPKTLTSILEEYFKQIDVLR